MKDELKFAFYKRTGEPWTYEEFETICDYVGAKDHPNANWDITAKYVFERDGVYFTWPVDHDLIECEMVAYEDLLPTLLVTDETSIADINDIEWIKIVPPIWYTSQHVPIFGYKIHVGKFSPNEWGSNIVVKHMRAYKMLVRSSSKEFKVLCKLKNMKIKSS